MRSLASLRVVALLLAALCAPQLAAAELNKCKGADGKVSFSDLPCPDQAGMKASSIVVPAKPEGGREYKFVASNHHMSGDVHHSIVRAMRQQCAAGHAPSCENYKAIEPASIQNEKDVTETNRNCFRGIEAACERLCQMDSSNKWCTKKKSASGLNTVPR